VGCFYHLQLSFRRYRHHTRTVQAVGSKLLLLCFQVVQTSRHQFRHTKVVSTRSVKAHVKAIRTLGTSGLRLPSARDGAPVVASLGRGSGLSNGREII
jgi:hypothetical protein